MHLFSSASFPKLSNTRSGRRAHFALTHPLSSPLSAELTPRGGHLEGDDAPLDGMPPGGVLESSLDLLKLFLIANLSLHPLDNLTSEL